MPAGRHRRRYLNEGVADFERDLALDGTALLGSVKSGLLVEVLAAGTPLEEWAADVRVHVRRVIQRRVAIHDPVAAAIVTAVLIGDRTGVPEAVRSVTRSQRTGKARARQGSMVIESPSL